MYTTAPSLELLFSSAARVKVLDLFILNPKSRYYQREISKLTQLPVRAVQRELLKMEMLGLLQKSDEGNRVYYQTNPDFILFPELKSMVLKTYGVGLALRGNIKDASDISVAFVYGSYAQNQETDLSDIDLFVVGQISSRVLHKLIRETRETTNREINYAIYTEDELKTKIQQEDHFVSNILKSEKIFLKGNEHLLQQITHRG